MVEEEGELIDGNKLRRDYYRRNDYKRIVYGLIIANENSIMS